MILVGSILQKDTGVCAILYNNIPIHAISFNPIMYRPIDLNTTLTL